MPIVDDRIVSMQFDNSDFDPNIKKSQKTLEEFEKTLDTKNFEKYADKLNGEKFNGLQTALTNLGNSFKSLETIAVGALLNIGAKIENFVSSTFKKMAVDPIAEGWNAYGENIGSVQTIMAATRTQFQSVADAIDRQDESVKNLTRSTGELYTASTIMEDQMKYVNHQLDELMAFTDETSASYQVMVNNIGKFTSQNIDLKTSVKAMEGIATWSYLSGANAEQMSRAMYNISQSLGVGRMLTRDWMSIENANMATVEFKNSAIEAAVALGQLQKDANGVVRTLNGKMTVSASNFRDTLSEDWFTSDVLLSALDKYGGFSQEIIALSKKTNSMVSNLLNDAIVPLSKGTISVSEAVESLGFSGEEGAKKLEDLGMTADDLTKTLEKLASKEYDLGRRAFEASFESKTLADAINYTGEAIRTGWVKTYQYIIGDYKEAKELWTWFAEVLYELFVSTGEVRNNILSIWKALKGREDLVASIKEIWSLLVTIGETFGEIVRTYFPKFKDAETGAKNIAAVLIALTRRFKDFVVRLKENETIMTAVTSAGRILGNVLRGLEEVIRIIYAFLGPTVRFTKQLFINTLKLLKPLADGADAVSGFEAGLEGLRVAFLVLGAAIALPIKLLSNVIYWLTKLGDMTLPELQTAIQTWASNVWNSIKSLFSTMLQLGSNVINGFKEGFGNGFKALGEFVKGLFKGLIEIVKNILGIHSPSTVFIAIGAFVIAGLIIGIASMNDKLQDSLGQVIDIFKKFAITIAGIAIAILIGIAVFKLLKGFSDISSGIGNIFKSISGFFNSAGNALNTYAKQKFKSAIIKSVGQTALMIAGSVAIVAASITAIALLSKEISPSVMNKAMAVIGVSAGIMLALIATFMILNKVLSKGSDSSSLSIGGKLFEKLGIDIKQITTSMSSVTVGMIQMAKTFLSLSVSIAIVAASITAMAKTMKDNNINVGTMFALAGLLQVLVTVLGSMVGLAIFIQKMNIVPEAFMQLKKYIMLGTSMLLSLSLMIALLSALNVSWSAIGQLAVIAVIITLFAGILVGLGYLIQKANIPMAALGKLALIVGIAVTAILTLAVSLAILGPALETLTEGLKVFQDYLSAFGKISSELNSAIWAFVLFSIGLAVASVFLSLAAVNIGSGLALFIPTILALAALTKIIGKTLKTFSTAFSEAVDNISVASQKFLANYDLFKLALEKIKELFTLDLLRPALVMASLASSILALGIAGWIAAGGLTLLIGTVKLAGLAINDMAKVMKFFETITFTQVGGMLALALGIMAIGLATTLTAPGILTLAVSILFVAGAVLALCAAITLLGNNINAANVVLEFLKEKINELITISLGFVAIIFAVGVALIAVGIGATLVAVALVLTAVATLALIINFGIAILLMLAFNAVMNKIKEDNPELYNSFIDIVKAITEIIKIIVIFFKIFVPIVEFVERVLERIPDEFIDSAVNCVKGFIEGISKVQELKNKVIDLANDILSWFKKVLHINSPSKETERYGEYFADGFVEGVENRKQGVLDYIKGFATSISDWFKSFLNMDAEVSANGRNIKIDTTFNDKWANGSSANTTPSSDNAYNDYYEKKLKQDQNSNNKTNNTLDDIEDTSNMTEEELREYLLHRKRQDKAEEEYTKTRDKSFGGMLGNIWGDLKETWESVKSGEITLGEGLKAVWASLKEHGGTFLGDKIDGIKDWLFGEGGILSGLGDFLKNPFDALDLDKILEEINNMNLDDALSNIEFPDNSPDLSNVGASVSTASGSRNENYIFTQNNYSPKALSRLEIYRQTKRQFNDFRVREVLGT